MNKKRFFAACTFLMIGAISLGVSIISPIQDNSVANADDEYTIVLDKTDEIPELGQSSKSCRFTTKTKLGNKIDFYCGEAIKNDNGFITLTKDGYFNNSRYRDSALSGLTSLTVSFEGVDELIVHYGWENMQSDIEFPSYGKITSTNPTFNFNNEYPDYFKIENPSQNNINISSITIKYNCSRTPTPVLDDTLVFYKEFDASDEYFVKSCKKDAIEITIPEYFNGLPITGIDNYAFENCTSLKSITFPKTLKTIRNGSFNGCTSLNNIILPDGITEIPGYCFTNCTSLSSIKLPRNLKTIGYLAFDRCTSLKTIEMSDGLTSVMQSAFEECSSLTNVLLPSTVEEIGPQAFAYCNSLVSIYLPSNIKILGSGAFRDCPKLQNINIPSNVTEIPDYFVTNCTSLEKIEVPYGVTNINYMAFSGCRSLNSITLPNSLTAIGERAFDDCVGLKSITLPSSLITIGAGAFGGCDALESINLPNGLKEILNGAFYGCTALKSIYIPKSVTYVGENAFGYMNNDFIIYSEIEEEPNNWDKGWNSRLYLNVWGHEATIADGDFEYFICNKGNVKYAIVKKYNGTAKELVIPNSVIYKGTECPITEIADKAFKCKRDIEVISFPDTVTTIGRNAFENCYGLREINWPKNLSTIKNQAFTDCNNLEVLNFPNGLNTIEGMAFYGCDKLKYVTIPESVTVIDDRGLANCANTTIINAAAVSKPSSWHINWCDPNIQVNWGYKGTEITSDNFEYIFGSTDEGNYAHIKKYIGNGVEVAIPSVIINNGETYHVHSILHNAFESCATITNVSIPHGITEIGNRAFYSCSSLKSIVIPNSVTTIGNYAFLDCSLNFMYMPKSVIKVGVQIMNPFQYGQVIIEHNSKPEGWNTDWNLYQNKIYWGCKGFGDTNSGLKYFIALIENETCAIIYGYTGADSNLIIPNEICHEGISYPVRCIEKNAFYDNQKIKSVTLPDTLKIIRSRAFKGCGLLESINLPSALKIIEEEVFFACDKLLKLVIPSSVESIGSRTVLSFYNKIVYIENETTPEGWANNWFDENTSLYFGYKGSGTTTDGFKYSVGTLNGKNWAIIEGYEGTEINVIIPETIVHDGITYTVETIQQNAFSENKTIESIKIPETVTTIEINAFSNCASLKSIYLPKSLKCIKKYAFYDTRLLSDIYYAGSEASWNSILIGEGNFNMKKPTIHYNYQ